MHCIPLDEATDRSSAGGKAVHLAWARAAGFRVPATTVIVRGALRRFLAHNHLHDALRAYLDLSRRGRVLESAFERLAARVRAAELPDDLSEAIRSAIAAHRAEAPDGLAVRSSAVFEDSDAAGFAGVFESFIGVRDTTQAVRAVVDCWLSTWAPRAVRYLDRMAIEPVIDAMAVLVQPVVQATAAGVIVTADPESGDPWTFVLHAAPGLAVDLISGSGAGDRYRLNWETGHIREQQLVGRAPVISTSQVTTIAAAARTLDEAASKRLDVEWAWSDGLWILQVRPLTALPPHRPPALDHLGATDAYQIAPWVLPLRGDLPQGFLTPLYADLSESELWYRYQPDDIVLTGIWTSGADVHGYRYVDTGPRPTFINHLTTIDDFDSWLDQHQASYRHRWERRHEELAEIETIARTALDDGRAAADLIPAVIAVRDRLWDLNAFGWSGPQALGWMCEAMLGRFLQRIGQTLTVSALIGGENSYTFNVAAALQDLGRSVEDERVRTVFATEPLDQVLPALQQRVPDCDFLRRYESLCWQFGRTPPSWRKRPPFWRTPWEDGDAPAMRAVRAAMRGEGRDVREAQRRARSARDRTEARVRRSLRMKAPADLDRFDRMLAWTRYWTQALNDRHGVTVGLLWERETIWRLGQRLSAEGLISQPAAVLLLRAADLTAYARDRDAAALLQTFAIRTQEHRHNIRFVAPARIGPGVGPSAPADRPSPVAETVALPGGTVTGTGFGRGHATGRARIIRALSPAVLDALAADDILVVLEENAFAYADWHSLLMLVKGVVSVSRPAHHLAQVAREVGVPVVGNVGAGIRRIADGSRLHLNAERGTVRIE